jgi:putative ABC transport system ATP-binding protein
MEEAHMEVLKLNKVSYQYPGTTNTVLKELNASFENGKVYAVMGKSGAGKSTLLSLISGLDVATAGSIKYNDQDLEKLDRDDYRAKSVGVVFQGYNLLTNATALDNIILSMNISKVKGGDKRVQAYELLEKVGIDKETANRKVLQLSGGEQQRVGIARALSHDPDVVIADEPTGNLDHETERNILDILLKLAHEEGKSVIIVTHSANVAKFADEVMQLTKGKFN